MAKRNNRNPRINAAMDVLELSAHALARESGVDHSLISKWQQGSRPLTKRSKQLVPMVRAMLRLDQHNELEQLYAPYSAPGESAEEALCKYLVGRELAALPAQLEPQQRQTSGEYTVQYRVFLGKQGFGNAVLTMLEYVEQLPAGRDAIVVYRSNCRWLEEETTFTKQFVAGQQKAMQRGMRLMLVRQSGLCAYDVAAVAWPYLLAHVRGYVQGFHFDGELPEGVCFVASIPGYCCAYMEKDPVVEDGLFTAMHTNPKDVEKYEKMCLRNKQMSMPASQYRFLEYPQGTEEDTCLWQPGPLPQCSAQPSTPDGSFYTICRVPGLGLMTQSEFRECIGRTAPPELPEYLFAADASFAKGPYRIILCREDVRDAFSKSRRAQEVLSSLCGRRVFVSQYVFRKQMQRLLDAMEQGDVEVALVPRVAFNKLQMEAISWRDSVSIGYLQDLSGSVFTKDAALSASFYKAIESVWDALLAGWKRKSTVQQQLRGWYNGKNLEEKLEDSSRVSNWSMMPEGVSEPKRTFNNRL